MQRRTKILATIGPASESEPMLRELIAAGMDAVRLNLSHGTIEDGLVLYERVRKLSADSGRHIGTLVDLPGPKIRAASFGKDGVDIADGTPVRLVPGVVSSTAEVIEVGYEDLLSHIEVGDKLAFGDGAIDCDVVDKDGTGLHGVIIHGGRLSGRPGVHIPSDRLRINTPTREDLRILDAFVEAGVDMVAVSFVRSAHDVRRVGTEPHPRGPLVVAKIETRAAIQNLGGILDASGAVMIARGDLGNECSIEELPHLQKYIIRECIAHGRPAITATQMLESMIHAPTPTRAEASDVANAIFDGSSAVMLSGETAMGSDPVNVVRTMARLAARADANFDYEAWALKVAQLRRRERQPRRLARPPSHRHDDRGDLAGGHRAGRQRHRGHLPQRLHRAGDRPLPAHGQHPGLQPRRTDAAPAVDLVGLHADAAVPGRQQRRDGGRGFEVGKAQGHLRPGDVVMVLAGTDARSKAPDVLRVISVP